MHSAFRLTRANSSTEPTTSLFAALNDLLRAVDGRVVLLRPLTDCFDWLHDDVDLLLTESQRQQLLRAAFSKCIRGEIHCHIQQSSPAKAQLVLWTIDCSRKLMVDLWTSFDQLPNRRRSRIPAERLLNTLIESYSPAQGSAMRRDPSVDKEANPSQHDDENGVIPALRQLSPDIELCLLIQHLAKKRSNLTTAVRRERIVRSCERLKAWSPAPALQHSQLAALREVAEQLPRAIIVTPKFISLSEDYLIRRLESAPQNRGLPALERRLRRGLMTEFRKGVLQHRPTVAMVGSDGAGKSSVVAALAIQQPTATTAVAKKYYRRSLLYQFASGLMKRLYGIDRSVFDDHISTLITLRSAAALWMRMSIPSNPWSGSRPSAIATNKPESNKGLIKLRSPRILDRSISSFLITGRKSDSPQLTRVATWIESITPPVTTVLLTLPYADLSRRKQEMSAPGHETYQRMLFEQSLRQRPVDLVLLASRSAADATATAIGKMLQIAGQPMRQPVETRDTGKVAA